MTLTALPAGARIKKYEVLSLIAAGGMGMVYKARDVELDRVVALKVLGEELTNRPMAVERFRREAKAAARLSHKNIVTLHDWGQDGDYHFLVLEYVHGIDLADLIVRRGKLDPDEARLVALQGARALEHAFKQGIIHRDIKPSNFLITNESGRSVVKLTDMGLALVVHENEFRVTRAGSTVGTIDYMSPEQARDSRAADIRSDIYSLGCTLYHMLTGQPPFSEGGLGERVYKHLKVDPPDARAVNPKISDELWAIVKRMLAKNPDDRYQTPAELIEALRDTEGETDEPRTSRPHLAPPGDDPRPPSMLLPDGSGTADAGAKARKRPSSDLEKDHTGDDPRTLAVTVEQRRAAAGQFERAREMLANPSRNRDYAFQLLLSCCKLDPTNLLYRRTLRNLERERPAGTLLGRLVWPLRRLFARARLKNALRRGDYRKVLDLGEWMLTHWSADVPVHLDMAAAAEDLELLSLAVWMLDQARQQAPNNLNLQRILARIYEKQNDLGQALALWEKIAKADPQDLDVRRKINELAARDTIARGNYRR